MTHTKGAPKGALKVFIATPTYTGKLDCQLVHSLLKSVPLLEREKIGFDLFTMSYHCHVDDARNEIVAKFLDSDCDSLVFIDADVAWHPESLLKLVQHDRDVVAGVYKKRSLHDNEFPVLVEPGIELWADKDGLVEVLGAPTGFMKIKRHVIETLAKSAKTYSKNYSKPGDSAISIIFERTFEDQKRFGGDLAFCRKWRKAGGKVFVDPEMQLTHTGEVQFSGTLGDFWREKHGVTQLEKQQRFNSAIENLRSGDCKEEDFINLFEAWGNPFAASPELLATCYWMAKQSTGAVLETGSGLSSLVMALANPDLTIHCLEHEILWATRLKLEMKIQNINNIVLHFAELKKYADGEWYDTSTLPKEPFSLALCDGPPRKISNRSIFYEKLSDQIRDAVVLMDDADDDAAVMPIKKWASSLGREVQVLGTSRRFAISNGVELCQQSAI